MSMMQMLAAFGGRAPIVQVGSVTTAAPGTSSTLTINAPTGIQNGDILVMVASVDSASGSGWTDTTGWTELADGTSANNGLRVAYKVASSEPASYTFTYSASRRCVGQIVAYRNAAFDVANIVITSTATSPITLPSVTTSSTPGLLLAFFATGGVTNAITTPDADFTLLNFAAASGGASNVIYAAPWSAAAGATGTQAFTISATTTRGFMLALKQA